MLPSFLTMAVIGAEVTDGTVRAQKTMSIIEPGQHSFGWMKWLITLTCTAIVALSLWHLLAARRRRIERQAVSAAPTRPGHRHPARRA